MSGAAGGPARGGGDDAPSLWRINAKIVGTVLVTLGVYTGISNVIPQVESEVPERVEISADVSPDELVGIGEEIFHGAGGCEACHGLGTRAPTLLGEIGTRCGQRVEGLSCKAYLHQSLVEPRAFVVDGFQPIMPNLEAQLSGGQIWALVAFLQSQGGEVTVTPADLEGASGGGGAGGGGGPASAEAASPGGESGGGGSLEPGALVRNYQCITCHQMEGEGGVVAPPVEEIRSAGHPAEYIRRSILEPMADTASGYSQDYSRFVGTMPANFGERLSDAELEALVEFLSQGGS